MSLTDLAAAGREKSDFTQAVKAANKRALTAIKQVPEFASVEQARINAVLEDSRVKIAYSDLTNAIEKTVDGNIGYALATEVSKRLNFEGDCYATQRATFIVLEAGVRACLEHDTFKPFVDRALQLYNAQSSHAIRNDLSKLASGMGQIQEILTSPGANVQSAPRLIADDGDETTPLHHELSALRRLVQRGQVRAVFDSIVEIERDRLDTASASERFRVLSLFANCHLQRHDDVEAARYLERACDACPTHLNASSHRATVSLLRGEFERAHDLAITALAIDPSEESAGVVLVMANAELDHEDTLDDIPEGLRENPEVRCALITLQRQANDPAWLDEAITLYEEASPCGPLSRISLYFAEAVADRAFVQGAIVGSTSPGQAIATRRLTEAATILVDYASRAIENESKYAETFVNNAVAPLRILGREPEAMALLDKARSANVQGDSLILQRAIITLVTEGPDAAMACLPVPCAHPEHCVIKAQCELSKDPSAALNTLEPLATDTPNDAHNRLVLSIRIHALLALDDLAGVQPIAVLVRERALSAEASWPDITLDLMCRRVLGESDATQRLETLVPRCLAEGSLLARVELADEAIEQRRAGLAVQLLHDVDRTIDGYPLRQLCYALWQNEAHRTLHELLEKLPDTLREEPCFTEYRLRLARLYGVGDVYGLHLDALNRYPNDAGLLRMFLGVASVEGELEQAQERLRSQSLTALEGDPEDRIVCSLLAVRSGRIQEGLDAAYQTLIQHWDNDAAHRCYRTVLVDPTIASEMDESHQVVAQQTVVSIKQNNTVRTHRIENIRGSAFAADQMLPESPFGRALIGKAVGESVVIPNNTNSDPWEVVSIKSAYNDLLVRSLERAETEDSASTGLTKMTVNPEEAGLGVEFMSMQQAIESDEIATMEWMRNPPAPLEMIGAVRGVSPLDIQFKLLQRDVTYRSVFDQAELRSSIVSIRNREPSGCVVDTFTLQIIYRLDLAAVVEAVCGPISITRTTMRAIHERAERAAMENDGQESMRIGMQDGELFRVLTSAADKNEYAEAAQSFLEWTRSHCHLIDTLPRTDTDPQQLESHADIAQTLGPMHSASAHDLAFVSSDLVARRFAVGCCQPIVAVPLVSVLFEGNRRNTVDIKQLLHIFFQLALGGERPAFINGHNLQAQWLRDSCAVEPVLRRAIDILVEPGTDPVHAGNTFAHLLNYADISQASVLQAGALRAAVFESFEKAYRPDMKARLHLTVSITKQANASVFAHYRKWSAEIRKTAPSA